MQKMERIRNRKILIVDDNKAIHEDFKKILGGTNELIDEISNLEKSIFGDSSIQSVNNDFEIDSAYQGEDALRLIRLSYEEERPYSLVFVDIRMPPGWDGIETISKIWEEFPDIQIIICTAYSDYSWLEILEKFGDTEKLLILKKPFDSIEVRQMAITMTEKWGLAKENLFYIQNLWSVIDEHNSELKKIVDMIDEGDKEEIRKSIQELIAKNSRELESIKSGSST